MAESKNIYVQKLKGFQNLDSACTNLILSNAAGQKTSKSGSGPLFYQFRSDPHLRSALTQTQGGIKPE